MLTAASMQKALDGHYGSDGRVSVWIGTFPDGASFERYFSERWGDADASPTCPFWDDLGIRWLDRDFQEGGHVGEPVPVAELLAPNWSFLDSFREALLARCAERGIVSANSVMFLYEYDYPDEAGYSRPELTCVGAFSYDGPGLSHGGGRGRDAS
jgi:hypothetical protein